MRKNLKAFYKKEIVPSLVKEFGYKNIEEVPKVLKVSINRGIGEDARGSKELAVSLKELATIAGQQPVINEARKSVAGFKIRDGMTVGTSVTLRKDRMYAFLERLIHIVLQRIRDFRGMFVSLLLQKQMKKLMVY